jgi:hypothetical protein
MYIEKGGSSVKPLYWREVNVGQRQGAQLRPSGEKQEIVCHRVEVPMPATAIITNEKRLECRKKAMVNK